MIRGFNRNIVCTPVESRAPEKTAVGTGSKVFNVITSRAKLVPLNVRIGDRENDIKEGDNVYLMHAVAAGLKPIEIEGVAGSFVIVPLDSVQLVERFRNE